MRIKPVHFIDIDTQKPDLQSIKAAQELLEKDYPIIFPSDTVYGILMRYSNENALRLHQLRREDQTKPFLLIISEDCDWHTLAQADALPQENIDLAITHWPGANTLIFPKAATLAYPAGDSIALRMPANDLNRAFHTLVQFCEFPLLAPSLNKPGEAIINTKAGAASSFPEIEYAFWDERFQGTNPSAIWDLRQSPALKVR